MRWSSAAARGLQHPTTVMIANNNNDVSEVKLSTGPATAATVLNKEVFLGIDAAKTKQVVVRFVPGEGAKPGEGMLVETLLKRVARLIKDGFRVHCVYARGC